MPQKQSALGRFFCGSRHLYQACPGTFQIVDVHVFASCDSLEREPDHLTVFAYGLTCSERMERELVTQRNVFKQLDRAVMVLPLDLNPLPRVQSSQRSGDIIGRIQHQGHYGTVLADRVQSASPMRLTTSSPSPSASPQVRVPLAISSITGSSWSAAA